MIQRRAGKGLCFLAAGLLVSACLPTASAQTVNPESDLFRLFTWRAMGPAVPGGRTTDIEAVEAQPWIIYAALGPSGVWKSENAGTTWTPVFHKESTVSVGDLAVSQNHPDIVWVGTGEATCRNSVTIGDGVYKSEDAGRTWSNKGLQETRHISRILIDRRDPNLVYVAAMGTLWSPNKERGVFKTTDGGTTWKKTLFIDENTGIADLAVDPFDARVLYAAAYDHRRLPWFYTSGGKGSGLYRSTDGGETWARLTKGLPEGLIGRIGLDVSRSASGVVYALIEAVDGALFRSEDRGETWERTCSTEIFNRVANRPFYYSQVRVDPVDDLKIYVLATGLSVSRDGGAHFQGIGLGTHSDHHSLWIDPANPLHLIEGNDGGLDISWDGGRTWDPVQSIDAAQVYQVGFDFDTPYNIYCGLQDNNAWGGPSASYDAGGVRNENWFVLSGGDGFFVQPDPKDPDTIYSNSQGNGIVRFDRRINQAVSVRPQASLFEPAYRYNWNSPIHLSPHDYRIVYCGAQFLLRSPDRGSTWEVVSPDLTTNDAAKQKDSGGPISPDNSTAESHCTITSISESPVTPGVIWVGTDDGNLQVTRDHGKSWSNTVKAIPGLPANTWCSRVEASHFESGTAYAAFDGHRTGDHRPYLFKTADFGRTWTSITSNLPDFGWIHVVREDVRNRRLLFAGTEFGIFASLDGGAGWFSFKNNLPTVAVHDLAVHPRENDLIIGTHGRGIWIMDDIRFLQEMTPAVMESPGHFFTVRPAVRAHLSAIRESFSRPPFAAKNPPAGMGITFYARTEPKEQPKVKITDAKGRLMGEFKLARKAGLQRMPWDLNYIPEIDGSKALAPNAAVFGVPIAPPGEYLLTVSIDGRSLEQKAVLLPDPRKPFDPSVHSAQVQAIVRASRQVAKLSAVVSAVRSLRDRFSKVVAAAAQATGENAAAAVRELAAFKPKLDPLASAILPKDFLNLADREQSLRGGTPYQSLVIISSGLSGSAAAPTAEQLKILGDLERLIGAQADQVNALVKIDVPRLNEALKKAGLAEPLPTPAEIKD